MVWTLLNFGRGRDQNRIGYIPLRPVRPGDTTGRHIAVRHGAACARALFSMMRSTLRSPPEIAAFVGIDDAQARHAPRRASQARSLAVPAEAFQPVIAVTCLSFEARIAAGAAVAVLHGNAPGLAARLESAVRSGSNGIISFGVAGGLAAGLRPGDCVVASGVVTSTKRFMTDRDWSRELMRAHPQAIHADIAGVDAPVVFPDEKRRLGEATATVAVDMESHVAAEIAEAHGVPFAALRVIIDPAHRELPPAALIQLRPDGKPDIKLVLGSLLRQPAQLPGLLRVAGDARAARKSLRRGRRELGVGLGFPAFRGRPMEAAP